MSEKQVVLTPTGLQRLEDELRHLQTVRRQEVADQIRQAKELGDVAENAEYETAKTEQAFLEGRIAELKGILSRAILVDQSDIPADSVGVGSVVRVRDLDLSEEWEFRLVGSFEADPDEGLLSNESPIGQAVFGKRIGDAVGVATPDGEIRYEIIEIRADTL